MSHPAVDLLGVRINNFTMEDALAFADSLVAARTPSYIVTPNVDVLVRLQSDTDFKRAYDGAAAVIADGVPLIWAARFLGTPLRAKVSGSDFFVSFCELSARKGHRLYFMGAMPGVAHKAAQVLVAKFPGLQVVGTYSPSYGFEANDDECRSIVRMLKKARPDVLFIGLGSPKQEKWTFRWMAEHGVPLSVGVGISFDYVAGTVKRAPRWMQNAGLEWSWRLAMEPKRLWRRYLVNDPVFFKYVFKQRLSQRR